PQQQPQTPPMMMPMMPPTIIQGGISHSQGSRRSYRSRSPHRVQGVPGQAPTPVVGSVSDSPTTDTVEELISSGPVIPDRLHEFITATTDSMSVCLYPSGIAKSQLESHKDQCLFPTGDRDLDRFFGLSSSTDLHVSKSNAEPGFSTRHSTFEQLKDQSEVSGKVAAVFKEASSIEISGGVFNNAGNDILHYQTVQDQQVHYYSTPLPPVPQQNEPGKESKNVWLMALLYIGLGFALGIIPTAIQKWAGKSKC
ncbi:hypothetical protein BKA70DRAFT_1309356, partial [Coprinopsis sp. MPI-PUGE-AT-0042]